MCCRHQLFLPVLRRNTASRMLTIVLLIRLFCCGGESGWKQPETDDWAEAGREGRDLERTQTYTLSHASHLNLNYVPFCAFVEMLAKKIATSYHHLPTHTHTHTHTHLYTLRGTDWEPLPHKTAQWTTSSRSIYVTNTNMAVASAQKKC